MAGLDVRGLVSELADEGSWVSWDSPAEDPVSLGESYAGILPRARERTGHDESVHTGECLLEGRRVAIVACEFSFLGGSIGVAAAERLVRGVERATAARLPLLASPASGGTRMQEGTIAFLQMVKISAAVSRHKAAGLPYLVYMRHPTTGGVLASWASLGHITTAEPGALIGFLGPRVYEALHGEPFPEGVQVAEHLYQHGLLDGVVPAADLRTLATRVLAVLSPPVTSIRAEGAGERADAADTQPVVRAGVTSAWEAVQRSRRPDRPGVRDLLETSACRVTPLHRTATGEREVALMLSLATVQEQPCVVLGQDREHQHARPPGPPELRVARRGMALAADLGLPLVTVVDTAGAELSPAAEIARCLADLVELSAPTACLLLGEGAGGAALALLPTDGVLAAQHGWLSPLPPEGAAAVVHRDTRRAAEVAADQRICATDLGADGIVDRVIPEQSDAADEPAAFLDRAATVLAAEIASLRRMAPGERQTARRERYRRLSLS